MVTAASTTGASSTPGRPAATRRIGMRSVDRLVEHRLTEAGLPSLLARLYAARGVRDPADAGDRMDQLLRPELMRGLGDAARLVADAIAAGESMLIVGDYDCDGATAIAVGVLGLRAFGAKVDYLVPNRFETGYGLTPEVARQAAGHPRLGRPDWLITVDNGVAAFDGVDEAHRLGMKVIVTDHHLPADRLPDVEALVNPNQPDCPFPSKSIAGVGVMFYLLIALRAELRSEHRRAAPGTEGATSAMPQQAIAPPPEPALARWLDLVALGTVADVVRLDHNNRVLVANGLRRIRAGKARPGLLALMRLAGREPRSASTTDLGFFIGPRLNAAGRLADMSIGVECLLADDPGVADRLATELDRINRERRTLQQQMNDQAGQLVLAHDDGETGPTHGYVLHDPSWHAGVIGLVASRIKEARHRPCIALAPADGPGGTAPASSSAPSPAADADHDPLLRGSGRSIPGVHLRDVLDRIDKLHPGMLLAFGGHAMAAGLTLRTSDVERFRAAFDEAVRVMGDPECWTPEVLTDGPLTDDELSLQSIDLIDGVVWGQGFAPPVFSGRFRVVRQRLVNQRHTSLELQSLDDHRRTWNAIAFNHTDPVPHEAAIAYRIQRDEYRGGGRISLIVEHLLEN